MMQLKYCVCPSLETLRSDSVGAGTSAPLRFVVWMHHKERRRASNTGKLLKLLLPDVTDILIHGVAEDDRRLEEIIQNSGGHAFVVYPSDDAVPVSAALAKTGSDVAPVAVLIDGTWNQAQRMHKHFEHLLHVVVQPAGTFGRVSLTVPATLQCSMQDRQAVFVWFLKQAARNVEYCHMLRR